MHAADSLHITIEGPATPNYGVDNMQTKSNQPLPVHLQTKLPHLLKICPGMSMKCSLNSVPPSELNSSCPNFETAGGELATSDKNKLKLNCVKHRETIPSFLQYSHLLCCSWSYRPIISLHISCISHLLL